MSDNMSDNVFVLQQPVRLGELSSAEISALNCAVHEAVLAVASELGHNCFAAAIIFNSSQQELKRAA